MIDTNLRHWLIMVFFFAAHIPFALALYWLIMRIEHRSAWRARRRLWVATISGRTTTAA